MSTWLGYSLQLFNKTNLGVTVKVFCRRDRVHNQLTISKEYYFRSSGWVQFNWLKSLRAEVRLL